MHFGLFIFGLVTLGACYIWKKDTSSAYSRYYSHTKNLRSKYEDNIYESIWFRIDQSSTHNIIKNLFEKDIFGSMSKDESLELLHDIAEYQRLWDSYS